MFDEKRVGGLAGGLACSALSTLRWYSLKNELQQCVKSCLRTAFLVAFDKDLLEQNPFSKMIKTPKTKGNAFDKLTEIIFSL